MSYHPNFQINKYFFTLMWTNKLLKFYGMLFFYYVKIIRHDYPLYTCLGTLSSVDLHFTPEANTNPKETSFAFPKSKYRN